jgi:hypothetical protein
MCSTVPGHYSRLQNRFPPIALKKFRARTMSANFGADTKLSIPVLSSRHRLVAGSVPLAYGHGILLDIVPVTTVENRAGLDIYSRYVVTNTIYENC